MNFRAKVRVRSLVVNGRCDRFLLRFCQMRSLLTKNLHRAIAILLGVIVFNLKAEVRLRSLFVNGRCTLYLVYCDRC
ncbi:MAG: hypothetical protein QNJ55_18960 [Xenococcus sp. MO_188.B8]|nr:hypothetical protein [Xenococcus sp. MO_188.B8]